MIPYEKKIIQFKIKLFCVCTDFINSKTPNAGNVKHIEKKIPFTTQNEGIFNI